MRRESEPTFRAHVKMFREDWEWINEHYGQTIGASKFIRTVVRAYIKQIRAAKEQHTDVRHSTTIELPSGLATGGTEGQQS